MSEKGSWLWNGAARKSDKEEKRKNRRKDLMKAEKTERCGKKNKEAAEWIGGLFCVVQGEKRRPGAVLARKKKQAAGRKYGGLFCKAFALRACAS